MKKYLSLILALMLVLGLSATAFAEEGTTTLTVNTPTAAAEPSFTLHVPADTTLVYGNTDFQSFGKAYVTDVENASRIEFQTPYTDLINTSDPGDSIALTVWMESGINNPENAIQVYHDGTNSHGSIWRFYDESWSSLGPGEEYEDIFFWAKVSDWSGATAAATYQAVVTFIVTVR